MDGGGEGAYDVTVLFIGNSLVKKVATAFTMLLRASRYCTLIKTVAFNWYTIVWTR